MGNPRAFALIAWLALAGCGEDEPPLEPPSVDIVEPATEAEPEGFEVPEGEDPNFHTMMEVLTSPRCVNCHPSDGVPKQTDAGRPHRFGVQGGESHIGVPGLVCGSCHQTTNDADSGVPGAPGWSLAPPSMAWEGLDRYAIARSMLDPVNNGDRTDEQLRHHLTEHPLVLWAWEPGVDADGEAREPAPVPLEEYRAAVNAWIDGGAQIPGDPPREPYVRGGDEGAGHEDEGEESESHGSEESE